MNEKEFLFCWLPTSHSNRSPLLMSEGNLWRSLLCRGSLSAQVSSSNLCYLSHYCLQFTNGLVACPPLWWFNIWGSIPSNFTYNKNLEFTIHYGWIKLLLYWIKFVWSQRFGLLSMEEGEFIKTYSGIGRGIVFMDTAMEKILRLDNLHRRRK